MTISKVAVGAALAATVLCSRTVHAQTLPDVTFDVTYGWGGHSDHAGSTWYNFEEYNHPRVAGSVNLWRVGPFGTFVTLEYIGEWLSGDQIGICNPAPDGSCRQYFPRMLGSGATAGLRATVSRVTLGAAFGRVGGGSWSSVDGEADVALASFLGAIIGARHAWRRGPAGEQIWFRPINAGLRLKF